MHCHTYATSCDIYAHNACVAGCADAMADAWEDTAGCAHADCLHGNILRYSRVIVHRYAGIAQDCAHRIIDCTQRMDKCAHIVMMQHSVTTHSW